MNQMHVLPDDVLLEIFDFFMDKSPSNEDTRSGLNKNNRAPIEAWQSLVHVCRRWRSLVPGSPRRLNLRLYCTCETPIKDTLDVWPALPLVVDWTRMISSSSSHMDNIIAALGRRNRVCQVDLFLVGGLLGTVLVMQVPFPELTDLRISSFMADLDPPTIPDSFLGGSAPRLRSFELGSTPFPGLPKLLLTATHLIELRLVNVPHSGFISPEAMAATISVLPGLRIPSLHFQSCPSRLASGSQSRSPPLPKRSILPALDNFHFTGASEYLEDFVTRIDTPQLDEMDISFFYQVDFDCSHLVQFIHRSPTLMVRDEAHVQLFDRDAGVTLLAQSGIIKIRISCMKLDRQLSSVTQVFNSPIHPLSLVEDLCIVHQYRRLFGAIEDGIWLRFLLPFTAVKNLYLSKEFVRGVAAALRELTGGRTTEVLPSLQNIFVDGLDILGPFQKNIEPFLAARQLSDHPIAISFWSDDCDMEPGNMTR